MPNLALLRGFSRVFNTIPPVLALLAGLAVASVLLLLLDANPVVAYQALFDGAFGSQNATSETLVKAIPLIFVGLGTCIAFRGGVVNIGGEGQMIVGALAGVAFALSFKELPGTLLIILTLCVGFLAGALWAGLAGVLKAYFEVNEILSTIMLNQIAVQLMNYLLNGALQEPNPEGGINRIPKTERIVEKAQLPRLSFSLPSPLDDVVKFLGLSDTAELFDRTRLHYGFVIAVVLAVVVYLLLWQTTLGYRIRAVGENDRAARYAGISVRRQIILAMFLAGGLAGLAGAIQVLGLQYRLQTDGSPAGFTGGAGFNGIVAALFGGLHPLGTIPAAIFFGGLLVGAQGMQRAVEVSASLITTINGLIVVFVVGSQIFVRRARYRALLAQRKEVERG